MAPSATSDTNGFQSNPYNTSKSRHGRKFITFDMAYDYDHQTDSFYSRDLTSKTQREYNRAIKALGKSASVQPPQAQQPEQLMQFGKDRKRRIDIAITNARREYREKPTHDLRHTIESSDHYPSVIAAIGESPNQLVTLEELVDIIDIFFSNDLSANSRDTALDYCDFEALAPVDLADPDQLLRFTVHS